MRCCGTATAPPSPRWRAATRSTSVLGELGIVGLVLIVVPILVILGAFAWRARGPDRVAGAALLGAGVGWAVHAGIDWDWEMPAVTA